MSEPERPTAAAAAPAPAPITVDELRSLEVFRDLPDGLLTWLVNHGETVALAKDSRSSSPVSPAIG